jgi:hypothetical protein
VGPDGPDLLAANLRKLFVGQLDRCCEKAIANVGRILPLAPAGGEDGGVGTAVVASKPVVRKQLLEGGGHVDLADPGVGLCLHHPELALG